MLINPRKRRRKVKARVRRRKHRARSVTRIRRRRSIMAYSPNPRKRRRRSRSMRSRMRGLRGFSPAGFVQGQLMPAGIGAVGALGLDVILNMLPLPVAFNTGYMRPVTRIAGAVGIGIIAGMVTNKRMGEQVAAGALTVTLYDLIKSFAVVNFPTLFTPNVTVAGMGMYPDNDRLSYADAGMTVGNMNENASIGEYVY